MKGGNDKIVTSASFVHLRSDAFFFWGGVSYRATNGVDFFVKIMGHNQTPGEVIV